MSDALINGTAGAIGGIFAQLITYPLQTVNTRQHTDKNPKNARKKLGTIGHMCQVVNQEGWVRLYGGLLPSIVGTAASQGVYYYFYQILRNKVEAAALARYRNGFGDGSVGMFSSLIVAALSGCVNVLITNPIWVVVTRMQTYRKESKKTYNSGLLISPAKIAAVEPPYGTSQAVQEVYREAGFWGFWKGVLPTLIMVSNPSIQFMLYETLLKHLKKKHASSKDNNKGISAGEIFILGAIAKLGATVLTYPVLIVKSRLQVKSAMEEDGNFQYKGTLDAFVKMMRSDGICGFYKGMSTKIVQSVLAAAILFMVKEELVKTAHLFVIKETVLSKKTNNKKL